MKRELKLEIAKFLLVGGLGYVIDFGLFNLLMHQAIEQKLEADPYWAKIISMTLAIVFTYFANSLWTFSHRKGRKRDYKQFLLFVGINVIGLLISLICLGISREILGLRNIVADNISANVIGVGIAMIFRFIANRLWVFPHTMSN